MCLLILAVLRAAKNDVALIRGQEDQFLLPVEAVDDRITLPLSESHLDRHANAAVGSEIEDQRGVAHPRDFPDEKDNIHASQIREMIGSGFVSRGEVVQRSILEVADV